MSTKLFLMTTNGDTAPPATDQKGMVGTEGVATNVGVQITGTWTGTVTFEGTIDGVTFVAIAATPSGGGADVTTTAANGAWRINARGYKGIRCRCTAAMTGTVNVLFDPAVES